MRNTSGFTRTLVSAGPAADRTTKMDLYGWLIGDWAFDATVHLDNGTTHMGQGEIHFAWALEGRAIQDVWILPGLFYGTTLRVYDPALDAWHIIWSDPVRQLYVRQLGRARGCDIVQEGQSDKGVPMRWSFLDIAPDSFRWLGECYLDGGASWHLQSEYRAKRVPQA